MVLHCFKRSGLALDDFPVASPCYMVPHLFPQLSRVLFQRFRNLADTSGTRRQVAFPATSFMLNEFCGYSHDDLPTDEVQNRLNGSAEQCWVRYTIRYVNAFTGSELVLLFFAPRSKRYCVKYAEMIVLEAE